MDSIVIVLIAIAAVLLLGALGEVLQQRTGIPELLWLMLVGALLGPVLGLVTPEELQRIAPDAATIAVALFAFEAGARLKLSGPSRPSRRSARLALLAFASTAIVVFVVAMLVSLTGAFGESFAAEHAALLAAAVGSAAASVSIPAIGRTRLDIRTQALLEGESSLSDVIAIAVAAIALDILTAEGEDLAGILVSALQTIPLGMTAGLIAGLGWILFLRVLRSSEHTFTSTLAASLIVFALLRLAKLDAVLGVLCFGLVVNNGDAIAQRLRLATSPFSLTEPSTIRSGASMVMRATLYTLAGLLLAPPWTALAWGLLLAVIAFGLRAPAVIIATRGTVNDPTSRWLLAIAAPRGSTAAALAVLPAAFAVDGSAQLCSLASATIFLSGALFVAGVLLLQRVRKDGLRASMDAEPPSVRPVSLIDSSARPATEPSAPDRDQWAVPPTSRVPTPLPVAPGTLLHGRSSPKPAVPGINVHPFDDGLEEIEPQDPTDTPRRVPSPPPRFSPRGGNPKS